MKKFANQTIFLLAVLLGVCLLEGCNEKKAGGVLGLFTEAIPLSVKEEYGVNDDSLGVVEGIVCQGNHLVVYDYHSGYCYSLFDKCSGKFVARFGKIGQGPGEIPSPCFGHLSAHDFSVFNDQSHFVMKYQLDSLRGDDAASSVTTMTKYDIPDAYLSQLVTMDDSLFLGAGTYKSLYQFVLFDKGNRVLDEGIEIYNAADDAFDTFTRFLSNQGSLVMHPDKNYFAYSLNFSSNIDFFKVENGKISLIKPQRRGNPIYHPVAEGGMFRANLTGDSEIGYIHLCATGRYLYALYSPEKAYESSRKSDTVLVFDWEGNPVMRYILDIPVYYIAVDEVRGRLISAIKNADDGWSIISYIM